MVSLMLEEHLMCFDNGRVRREHQITFVSSRRMIGQILTMQDTGAGVIMMEHFRPIVNDFLQLLMFVVIVGHAPGVRWVEDLQEFAHAVVIAYVVAMATRRLVDVALEADCRELVEAMLSETRHGHLTKITVFVVLENILLPTWQDHISRLK